MCAHACQAHREGACPSGSPPLSRLRPFDHHRRWCLRSCLRSLRLRASRRPPRHVLPARAMPSVSSSHLPAISAADNSRPAGARISLIFHLNCYARVAHADPLCGMLARERTCYLCPSLLDRWHLQCAAGLDRLAMGDRAATPCDRSLGCGATPSTYPAGCASLVARGIGLASVHDSRAERFLPGPDGHVPFSFPRFATHRLARTTLLLCGMFALRSGIYRSPIY